MAANKHLPSVSQFSVQWQAGNSPLLRQPGSWNNSAKINASARQPIWMALPFTHVKFKYKYTHTFMEAPPITYEMVNGEGGGGGSFRSPDLRTYLHSLVGFHYRPAPHCWKMPALHIPPRGLQTLYKLGRRTLLILDFYIMFVYCYTIIGIILQGVPWWIPKWKWVRRPHRPLLSILSLCCWEKPPQGSPAWNNFANITMNDIKFIPTSYLSPASPLVLVE